MSEENKAVYRKLVEGINNGNAEILDEVYSPSLVYHGTGPSVNADRESVKQYLTAVVAAFPESKMTIDDLLADGDKGDLTPENSNSGKESPPGRIGHSKEGSWHGRGTQRSRS